MKDRKIILALQGLDVYQLNRFSKFVHSPYFNSNDIISNYFDELYLLIKENKIDEFDGQQLWNKVHPNLEYNNQKFLKLNSDLVKLLEDFLAQSEFDQLTSFRANLKLEGARKNGIVKLYNGIVAEIDRLVKMEQNQSVDYYYYKYLVEKNLFNINTENEKMDEKYEIEAVVNLVSISKNLDQFYLAEKLRLYCTLLSWKKMYKLNIEMENLDLVFTNIEKYKESPAIQLYNVMHLTFLESENESHYYKLRKMMKKYIHLFPIEEVNDIYITAISYCVNKVNKGNLEFQRETFELYNETIDNETILINKEITATTFRNIVFFALRVEEFDWVEYFIKDYQQYVDIKFRDNAVQLSLARLEFYRKNFGKVLDHLNQVSYEDVWYSLGAKVLQLASYYELEEIDALESFLQAFKMYIRREKSLTIQRKNSHSNLIKFTYNLMKLTTRDQEKLIKLKQEIEATSGVVSKPWLLEKVDEMIKK